MNLSTILILSIIISIAIIWVVFDYHQSTLFIIKNQFRNRSAKHFVNVIDKLGYFKYHQIENIDRIKSGIRIFHLSENKIEMLWHEDIIKNDIRFYRIEADFEIEYLVNLLEPLFQKIGLDINKFNFDFQKVELDRDIFELVKAINIELKNRSIDEKIYLFDSTVFQIAILTKELYQYVKSNSNSNAVTKPLTEFEWIERIKRLS